MQMKKGKLLFVRGKPVKFARFGGLSPVPQKGYKKSDSFHCPPAKAGIFVFVWPYIERFLLSAEKYSGVHAKHPKFVFTKDKEGTPITDKHPDFEKLAASNKNWTVPIDRDTNNCPNGYYLVRAIRPKVFEYYGELWHHLCEQLEPWQIIAEHGAWVLSTYPAYVCALKKEFHKMAKQPLFGTSIGRWTETNNPTRWWAKDDLEVFIERI